MKRTLLALGATLALNGGLQADELAPIIVSDDRSAETDSDSPVHIEVIDRTEIENSGANTVAELLQGRAGIHVSDLFGDGSNASIDMRGFGPNAGSNVLVMVDGRRLNSSADKASLYLNSIDLDTVEQIEVIQGSTAILYGNQAVGGAINIITRKPGAAFRKLGGGVGSYNTGELNLYASERTASGIGYRLTAQKRESDNYRDNNNADLANLNALFDYRLPQGRVYAEVEHYDEFTETPGALFGYELAVDRQQSAVVYADDYLDTGSDLLRVGLEQRINGNWRFEGDMSYREEKRDFVQSFRTFPADPNNPSMQDRKVFTLNPRLIGQLGSSTLTLGSDWENTGYDLLTSFGPQANNQNVIAVYGQAMVPFGPQLSGTFGLRHGRVYNHMYYTDPNTFMNVWGDVNDQVNIGSAGLSYRPNGAWRLFARAEQNYRFAKVDEHTNPVYGQPVGLDTQTGITYELGSEYRHKAVQASALVYRLELHNEISFDASGFSNINLDQTRRLGLSLSASAPVAADLLAGFNYDFVDSEITDGPFQGNQVPQVPEHRARVFSEWSATVHSTLFAEVLYVSDQVLGGDFSNAYNKLAGYTVVNLNARYQHGDWVFSARLNNLLDQKYSESGALGLEEDAYANYPMVKDPIPSYYPAPERNLWLTVSYQH